MNGTSMPYEYSPQKYSEVPVGFTPFYINYLGRHGSRNPLDGAYLDQTIQVLLRAEKNDMLTDKGKELLLQLRSIKKRCENQWGLLTRKGEEQIAGIANRMMDHYAEIFTEDIYLQSTPEERCLASMNVFIHIIADRSTPRSMNAEILSKASPTLGFFALNEAYIKYYKNGRWKDIYQKYGDSIYESSGLLKEIFLDERFAGKDNGLSFLHSLYKVYSIMPNTEIAFSLNDFFTQQDIYNMWNVDNVREYLQKGPSPVSKWQSIYISFALLRDFLETSNNAITEGNVSGDFRFAHAETLIPFAAILGISGADCIVSKPENIDSCWLDFRISPMAANLQWIFYSNVQGKILVKMLLNEKEVDFPVKSALSPYYYWEDVYKYYNNLLESLPIRNSLSEEKQVEYFQIN